EWAAATGRMIEDEGGRALVLPCDVSSEEECREAVSQVLRQWGRVDILVNNVGVGGPAGNAVDLDLQEWDRALRVNVTSMMLMARHCIPAMREQRRGAIGNVASVAGLRSEEHTSELQSRENLVCRR